MKLLLSYVQLLPMLSTIAIGYALALLLLPRLIRTIEKSGFVVANYQGVMIPNAAGVVFILLYPAVLFLSAYFGLLSSSLDKVFLFIFLTVFVGVLGFLDDSWGDHGVKGFHGHLGVFFAAGELTTGGIKALFSLLAAAVFSLMILKMPPQAIPFAGPAMFLLNWAVNVLVILLVINAVNLFDLRPGRAGKVFLLALIPLYFLSQHPGDFPLVYPLLGMLLAYLPYDLKARVMLGDTGANLLGAFLGGMFAAIYSLLGKIIVILVCLALNLIAEKYSFSKIIEQNLILRLLDRWGRMG